MLRRRLGPFAFLAALVLSSSFAAGARADEEPPPHIETTPPPPPPSPPSPPDPPRIDPLHPETQLLFSVDPRGADGLRADLERIVSSEEGSGWFLDSTHFDAVHPAVFQSVCRTSLGGRRVLLDRLEHELSEKGEPRALYAAAGNKLTSNVEEALHVQRLKASLERAMRASTECPFWIEPKMGFDGRQTDRNRFTLNAETGGLFQFRFANGKTTVGGGPSIRGLVGYTFQHVGFFTGVELAGGPMLREDDSSKVALSYFPAIPFVVRVRDVNWVYSLETGLLSTFDQENTDPTFGFRAGLGVGLMALRTRFFIPWAGVAAFYEHYFPGAGRSAAELLRGGLRVGIIFDP